MVTPGNDPLDFAAVESWAVELLSSSKKPIKEVRRLVSLLRIAHHPASPVRLTPLILVKRADHIGLLIRLHISHPGTFTPSELTLPYHKHHAGFATPLHPIHRHLFLWLYRWYDSQTPLWTDRSVSRDLYIRHVNGRQTNPGVEYLR